MLRRINCKDRLLDILNRRKLKFIGHVMRSESLEKNLLTGMVIGNRGRGRPKTRLSDNIKDICGLTMVQVERKAQDRVEWRRMVERCTARGVHLTRFWSGTCHRGLKNIPVPYTNFLKKYIRPYTNFSKKYIRPYIFHLKILKIGTVPYTKIVKIDTVLYTNIWKIDTLSDGTSPYPKYM